MLARCQSFGYIFSAAGQLLIRNTAKLGEKIAIFSSTSFPFKRYSRR
jgi:hypothetical protein